MIPVYLDNIPAGSSTRPFVHYAQLHLRDREFRKYDYGSQEGNMAHYGQPEPPLYDLSKVKVPTALFLGDKDDLATVADGQHLGKVLPCVSLVHVVDFEGFTHLDFSIAIDANVLVYKTILEMMGDRNMNK